MPLQLHLNASADELRNLYATASLFWHGTGLGEDPARHPERFEHFGISTVEAMSAGAVPLTLGEGGQAELFEHGVEGFHYRNVAELVAYTQNLIADPARRERMGHQAQQRAARFDFEQFATALLGIVGRPG